MTPWFKAPSQKMTRNGPSLFLLIGATAVSGCYAFNHSTHGSFLSHSKPLQKEHRHIRCDVSTSQHHERIEANPSVTTSLSPMGGRNVAMNDRGSRPNVRTYTTDADIYYKINHQIPLPAILHDSLDEMIQRDKRLLKQVVTDEVGARPERILVIGDIHGCYAEMKSLVHKATVECNGNKPFMAVVMVGDLCNKGPNSAEVVHLVRTQKNWYTVRGNHDNAALAAALGDETRCVKEKYRWVSKLSDKDIDWLSDLPYTITIPRTMLGSKEEGSKLPQRDVTVVHAGLIPGVPLCEQEIKTMTTIREVIKTSDGSYEYFTKSNNEGGTSHPWARVWNGPQQIIFGHDAKRGYQSESLAIGLDEGCCYGKKLTGIILPDKKLVSVSAEKVHCPIKRT